MVVTRVLLAALAVTAAAVTFLGGEAGARQRCERSSAAKAEPMGTSPSATDDPQQAGEVADASGMRVVDDLTGAPVAGARITFYRALWHEGTVELAAAAETDVAGRFAAPEDFPVYRLVVEADGYPPRAEDPDRGEREIRLDHGTTRTLTIVDEEGSPLAGAEIDVFGDTYRLMLRLRTERADSQGQATLWVAGNETLLVRFPGCGYEEADDDRVVLRRGYSIGGSVIDSANRPIAGARVHVAQGWG
jgi:hypothetical protein